MNAGFDPSKVGVVKLRLDKGRKAILARKDNRRSDEKNKVSAIPLSTPRLVCSDRGASDDVAAHVPRGQVGITQGGRITHSLMVCCSLANGACTALVPLPVVVFAGQVHRGLGHVDGITYLFLIHNHPNTRGRRNRNRKNCYTGFLYCVAGRDRCP